MYVKFVAKAYVSIFIFILLTSCLNNGISIAERSIIGTWKSEDSEITFEFFDTSKYIISNMEKDNISGNFNVSGDNNSADMSNHTVDLEGVNFHLRFLNSSKGFVIDYGDGLTSKAIFYQTNEKSD